MPEKLTIKRRIELQLIAIVGAALPGWMDEEITAGRASAEDKTRADATEFDLLGTDDSRFSMYLDGGEEEIEEGSQGTGGTVGRTMQVLLATRAPSVSAGDEPANAAHGRWLGRMEQAVMADPYLIEDGTGEPLSTEVLVTDTLRGPLAEEMPEQSSMIVIEVTYETLRGNPYQGPANTERTG